MSWQTRPYANPGPEDYPGGGGWRSWMGGMPKPGMTVKWIIIANVAVYVLGLLTGGHDGFLYRSLEMRTDLVLRGQVWRLFTFTYLHDLGSIWHIFLNMLGLYMLGIGLENLWGPKRFFIFYTLGGFIAVMLYLLVTWIGWLSAGAGLIGASGGVLAVLGACAVLFPGTRIFIFFFPVPIRTAVMLFTLLFVFNLIGRGANAGGDACHLAGMAFGVAYGYRGESWVYWWKSWRGRLRRRAEEAHRRAEQHKQDEVDRILDKVHSSGIQSLTRREKAFLEDATHRQRKESTRR